jgi:TolB-like protein
MISSVAFSNKLILIITIVGFLLFPNLADTEEVGKRGPIAREGGKRIAIYPVENLTGGAAPIKEIRQMCIEKLKAQGVDVLEEEVLEKFMAKYRIRNTGGVNSEIAKAFKRDIHVEGVFITSLGFYSDANPPKISLFSRLVSTGEDPSILWMDGVGLAGDDSPGILGMGLIQDPKVLADKALKVILDSLSKYISTGGEGGEVHSVRRRFRPKVSYRSPRLDPNKKYMVAIAPFFNLSLRKYAGDMMVLHFAKELKKISNFNVIEPGVIRQVFLELRIIMDQGISLANADSISAALDADLILAGEVIDYEDYAGMLGTPKVSFSAQLIERKSREVVWSSNSYNRGDDGVFFFDRGRVNTAYAMASEMIQSIGKMMLEDSKGVQGVEGSRGRVK